MEPDGLFLTAGPIRKTPKMLEHCPGNAAGALGYCIVVMMLRANFGLNP